MSEPIVMHRDSPAAGKPAHPRIAVVSPVAGTLEQLRGMLQAWDGAARIALVAGGVEQVGRVIEQEQPDVLVIEGRRHDEEELYALERLIARHRSVTAIMLSPNQSPAFLRHGMRIGLREMLPMPVGKEALVEALERAQQWMAPASAPARRGRILSLIGCKGGSGTTFLATNLGYALAQQAGTRVALIDLNCQFGDASFYVSDRVPGSHLADVAKQVHRLDGSLLESSMVQVLPNYFVLAAPEEPEQALQVKPEHIDALLWVAASHYDIVLVDAGRSLDSITVRAMDQSETIFTVLQLTLPFVRDAKRLIRALGALGYASDRIRLLVNRNEKGGVISVDDVAATLGRAVFRAVPNSHAAVAASINQGVPILRLAPGDPVAKALRQMATALAPAGGKGRGGWLKALLPGSLARAASLT